MSCRLLKRYFAGSTYFNGSTSKITVTTLDFTVPTTRPTGVSFLFRFKPTANGEWIFSRRAGTGDGLRIRVNSNKLSGNWERSSGAGGITNSSNNVRFNQWNYGIVYIGSTRSSTWLNGVKTETTYAVTVYNIVDGLILGGSYLGTFTKCNLAEFGVIFRELTDEEAITATSSGVLPDDTAHFFPLSDQPSTYLDTIGGATGTGTATTYSPDVPVQLPVMVDEGARSSLSFDGVDDVVTIPTSASLNIRDEITVAVSARFIGTQNTNQSPLRASIDQYGFLSAGDGTLDFRVAETDGTQRTSGYISGLTNGELSKIGHRMFVGTAKTGEAVKFYINGLLAKTGETLVGQIREFTTGNLTIGYEGASTRYMKGIIKSVRIWNTALTDQQIRDLHFSNIVPTEGLVLNLELNEGAGTTAYDSSGNGNDGTITGATWSAVVPSKAREVIGGNLVKNGDFSYVPRVNVATTTNARWIDGTAGGSTTNKLFGWKVGMSGTAEVTFDTSEVLGNKNSIKLSTKAAGSQLSISLGTFVEGKRIRIKPSTSYTFTGWMKTNYVSGDATSGAAFAVLPCSADGTIRTTLTSTYIKTTTGWTKYTITFTTDATDALIQFDHRIYGHQGTATLIMDAWFADIHLQETTLPTRATATTRTTVTCP